MKIKIFPTIIALAICALLAYGLYSWCKSDEHQLLMTIGGFFSLFFSLTVCLGVRFGERTTASTIVVGGIFFIATLVSNVLFALFGLSAAAYIIINGIILLTMIGIVYGLAKTNY